MTKKYILKIACIYTGAILGAGFATGKELVSFFAVFNKIGIISFLISCILLGLCCLSILSVIHKTKCNTYKEFMYSIFGKLGKYIEIFNILLLFILFSAMLSGGSATLSNTFYIDENIATIIFCICVFFALLFGEKSIININTILCPILVIGGMLIGIYLYFFETANVFNNYSKAIISPFVYTSYNTITTISILFSLKNLIINKKVILYSSLLGAVFIFCIGIFMLLPLIENYEIIKNKTLPLFSLIKSSTIKNIYVTTVLSAIFTTAISNGFALENTFREKININKIFLKIIIIFLGVIFSLLGFSKIVEVVYPIFGYLGMFEILIIVITFFTKSIDK